MKRLIHLMLIILCIFCFASNYDVSAKTIGDLKNELQALRDKKAASDTKKKATEEEINKVNVQVKRITALITTSENKIKDMNKDIVNLEAKAEEKEDEIKDIVNFLQIANSENAYLEYVFGATSIDDLILRSAISEQLVDYNNDLISQYNETVKAHRIKIEEMNQEIINLDIEQKNLEVELVKLGDSLEDATDISVNIADEIKAQEKIINYYVNTLKCTDNQDINTCGNIPYSGKMIRPVVSGAVTSLFGWRLHPTKKVYKLHSGVDMAGGSTDVYAVAPGTVAGFIWQSGCGGTMMFIHHNINGVFYTSAYYHLYKVLVKEGDYVDQNTKIAITGGASYLTPWDTCTTGRHLHLSIARGLYLKEYSDWSTYTSKLIDPMSVVNFPAKGIWFSNRTKIY